MAKSVLYMSMSLDGFITGPHDGPGNGLGIGGNRLHEWLGEPVSELPYFDPPGLSGQVFAELMATRAVVVGRKTFDYAGQWGGDHHGVPIFVPTRGTPPAPQSGWVHYVPDAATAMRDAKAAACDQDVMVHGAALRSRWLREGLLDELEIHLIPVVLGDGRRLFGADRGHPEHARRDRVACRLQVRQDQTPAVVSDPQQSRICREVEQRTLVGDSERPVLQVHRELGGRSASGCQAAEYRRLPRSVWRHSRREPEVLPPDRTGSGQLPPEGWVGRDDNRRRRADGRRRQADLRPEQLTRTRELAAAVVAASLIPLEPTPVHGRKPGRASQSPPSSRSLATQRSPNRIQG